ncbi:MAG TPA: hypothetical protein VF842_08265 [Flavobacterium sp.]
MVNSGKVTAEDPKETSAHSIWLFSSDKVAGFQVKINLQSGKLITPIEKFLDRKTAWLSRMDSGM